MCPPYPFVEPRDANTTNDSAKYPPPIFKSNQLCFIRNRSVVTIEQQDVFFLSMVIYLMNYINPKHSIQSKFKALLAKYLNIDIQAMGFPTTWQNEPLWK